MLLIEILKVGSNCNAKETPSTTPTVAPPSIDNTFEKSKTSSEFGGNLPAFR